MEQLLQWIDALWLLVALAVIHKKQLPYALGLIAGGMVMLRLQVELMVFSDYPRGLLQIFDMHVFYRGLAVYSLFYAGYFILAHYFPKDRGVFFLAETVSLFLGAAALSSFVMVL